MRLIVNVGDVCRLSFVVRVRVMMISDDDLPPDPHPDPDVFAAEDMSMVCAAESSLTYSPRYTHMSTPIARLAQLTSTSAQAEEQGTGNHTPSARAPYPHPFPYRRTLI